MFLWFSDSKLKIQIIALYSHDMYNVAKTKSP